MKLEIYIRRETSEENKRIIKYLKNTIPILRNKINDIDIEVLKTKSDVKKLKRETNKNIELPMVIFKKKYICDADTIIKYLDNIINSIKQEMKNNRVIKNPDLSSIQQYHNDIMNDNDDDIDEAEEFKKNINSKMRQIQEQRSNRSPKKSGRFQNSRTSNMNKTMVENIRTQKPDLEPDDPDLKRYMENMTVTDIGEGNFTHQSPIDLTPIF